MMVTLALAGVTMPAFSQKPGRETMAEPETNIVTEIEESSNGNVEIIIPDEILDQVLSNKDVPKKPANTGRHTSSKTNGFRIQVFSDGRNQSTLEARAKARGSAIAARFPKFRGQIYTFSSSPNWYTRIGNFRSQAEANAALAELKRAFPQFSSEMRVVKSKIITR